MWKIWMICFVSIVFGSHCTAETFDYTSLDRVLQRSVDTQGHVDYRVLKTDVDLKYLVDHLSKVSPDTHPELFPTRSDSLAFWINAYNVFVLHGVAKAYPIGSVREIAPDFGFFKKQYVIVGGRSFTLDDIENKIIRNVFADPRIHAAINCAAIGCPRIQGKSFNSNGLEGQLQAAMQAMINDPQHVMIDRKAGFVALSSIFNWFETDFSGEPENKSKTVLGYISDFLNEGDQEFLAQHPDIEVRFLDYDWALNDQKQ